MATRPVAARVIFLQVLFTCAPDESHHKCACQQWMCDALASARAGIWASRSLLEECVASVGILSANQAVDGASSSGSSHRENQLHPLIKRPWTRLMEGREPRASATSNKSLLFGNHSSRGLEGVLTFPPLHRKLNDDLVSSASTLRRLCRRRSSLKLLAGVEAATAAGNGPSIELTAQVFPSSLILSCTVFSFSFLFLLSLVDAGLIDIGAASQTSSRHCRFDTGCRGVFASSIVFFVVVNMKPKSGSEDSLEPTCTFDFFDCLSPKPEQETENQEAQRAGIEREMRVMYQQPHLVPPMKLTVFDGLPPTPTPQPPSQLSQWVSQGKASLRSSLSLRRHASSSPVISGPQPPLPSSQQLPFRRAAAEYRPLELSIYMPNNRLSNLPEFDRMSFTDIGEIKLPPRALVRTKSEEFIPHKVSLLPAPVKPASMIEQRGMYHRRPEISSTVMSISRPPSEYDALHSHPVSWSSLPGLPPPAHLPGRGDGSVAVLSPMAEEFSPSLASVAIGGTVLPFPEVTQVPSTSRSQSPRMSSETSASAPVVPSGPTRNFSKPTDMNSPSGYFHPNYQMQKRISQWLANRSHSSSISTTKSAATSASFAEHRRKRSHFYQLATAPPTPLTLSPRQHHRTMTESTIASTVDTDILSLTNPSQTDTTVTTMVGEGQSRSGLIKTLSKSGLRPIVSGVPDVPPCYAEVIKGDGDVLIKEIGGPLRSPGVGVAF